MFRAVPTKRRPKAVSNNTRGVYRHQNIKEASQQIRRNEWEEANMTHTHIQRWKPTWNRNQEFQQVSQIKQALKTTRKKTKTGSPITLKGNMTEFGAVLGTKDKNYKEIFQNLQENVLQHEVENYYKGVDLAPLTSKLEDVDLTNNELGPPTGSGSKLPSYIT